MVLRQSLKGSKDLKKIRIHRVLTEYLYICKSVYFKMVVVVVMELWWEQEDKWGQVYAFK